MRRTNAGRTLYPWIVGLAWALAALAAAPALAAQDGGGAAAEPPSVWYEFTVGGASARLTCRLCQPAWNLGPVVTAAVGGYAGQRLRLGVEVSRWTYLDPGARETLTGIGLVMHLQPNPGRGLYLTGGLGWSGYRAGDFSYDAPRLTLGAGWDVPAFGRWVVGNVVALDASAFAPLRNGDVTVVPQAGHGAVRFAVQMRRR
ncbi:MAG: hypothetical protein OEW77_03935 [Gemmatimonadota bacterium]|nr:hypothetical protein [Gemmatimonadota bacterium]